MRLFDEANRTGRQKIPCGETYCHGISWMKRKLVEVR